MRNRKHLN